MSKGYRYPATRHLYHSLDVTFLETVSFFPDLSFPPSEALKEPVVAGDSIMSRPVPIFDSTSDSLPLVITSDPSQVYSCRPLPLVIFYTFKYFSSSFIF